MDIKDFADDFADGVINPDYWPNLANFWLGTNPDTGQPYVREYGGALHFEDQHADEAAVPVDFTWPRTHGSRWQVTFPYGGPEMRVRFDGPFTSMEILMGTGYATVTTGWVGNVSGTWGYRNDEYHGDFQYFRVTRNRVWQPDADPPVLWPNDFFYLEVSDDATTWHPVAQTGLLPEGSDMDSAPYTIFTELNGYVDILDVRGVTVALAPMPGDDVDTTTTPPAPAIWNPPEGPDPLGSQDASASGKSTLLELVRTFSAAVNQAVRIVGPLTIEMVDPNLPLPDGWSDDDAGDLYVSATRSVNANTKVLSVRSGNVSLTASAQWKADDVRLLRSTWRLPDRLPVYGLPAAPVQRISYTFGPNGYSASLDFHYHDVPLHGP